MTYHWICCRISPALRTRRPNVMFWSRVRCLLADATGLTWQVT